MFAKLSWKSSRLWIFVAAAIVGGQSAGMAQQPAPDLDATLKIAHQVPPASLDPHMQFALAEGTFSNMIYDRLTIFGPDKQPRPMLAKSWKFASDGSYLELALRDDVKFHDGVRFDA